MNKIDLTVAVLSILVISLVVTNNITDRKYIKLEKQNEIQNAKLDSLQKVMNVNSFFLNLKN